MKNKELKELTDLETMPRELKVVAFLALVEKAMTKANLTWRDIDSQLVGKTCPLCSSKVSKCLNCGQPSAIGSINCIRCGMSLERLQIEPSKRL